MFENDDSMRCGKCGNLMREDENFCPVCGAQRDIIEIYEPEMVCPNCGKELGAKMAFCTNCGQSVSARADAKPPRDDSERKDGRNKLFLVLSACGMAALTAAVILTCDFGIFREDRTDNVGETVEVRDEVAYEAEVMTEEPAPTEAVLPTRGTKEPIPEEVREFMNGKSMTSNDNIGYDDLSYLTIPYIDFNDERQIGHMVIAVDLADEVLDIFSDLYKIRYPIERMELVDYFFDRQTEILDTPDRASMGNNNTSAFYYRVVSGTNTLSNHARGRAIDLNTKVNPYVDGSYVSPRNAVKYADRTCDGWTDVEKRAFIGPDTEVYRIFTSRGWEWGGEIWSYQDYQHFQKR